MKNKQVSKGEYGAYIRSEKWDKKRRKRLEVDGHTCQDCRCTDRPLDVHHLNYNRLGRERMSDLVSLCRRCHDKRHRNGTILIEFCQTCGQILIIIKHWLKDGWTRWVCSDGHVVEKKGWK